MGRVVRAGLLVPVLAGIGVAGVAQAQTVSVPDAAPAAVDAGGTINAGQVNGVGGGTGTDVPGATEAPTQQQIFQSGDTTRVLDKEMTQILGPVPSAGQILQMAPGVNVNSYGNTGASRATFSIDGLNQGWTGYGGYSGAAALQITLDGVPMNDPVTGLWQSTTLPQMGMIANTTVTYGPGEAANRWYDNVGGQIEFTPIQPSNTAGGDINLSYGSFNTQNLEFDLRSGVYDGWSTVIAGGAGQGDSFRTAADGFNSPNHDYSLYGKTIKTFSDGDVSFGGFFGKGGGYRPNIIPGQPNSAITINGQNAAGLPIPGQLYSQQSSGFYSALPFATYEKYLSQQLWTVYGKENWRLDPYTTLHNMTWYTDEQRLHSRINNYLRGNVNDYELNTPNDRTFGDKLSLTRTLPYNTVDVGAYYIYSNYNGVVSLWNPGLTFPGTNIPGSVTMPNGIYHNNTYAYSNSAFYLQDDISPFKALHITPGVRFVDYNINYANGGQNAFPGAYALDPTANQGYGLSQYAQQNRTGVEPSIDVNLDMTKWLSFYGSYDEAYKSPSLNGGGGIFVSIPQQYYQLELAQEGQVGFKMNVTDAGWLNKFLLQANYFHLRYADQNVNTVLATGAVISGVGTSTYQGMNFYFDDNPAYNWHVFTNAAVEAAYYTNYQTGSVTNPTKYSGLPVPYVPQQTVNVGTYVKQNVGNVVVTPGAWFQFTGEQFIFNNLTAAPSKQGAVPAYGTLNLSLDVKVPVDLLGPKVLDFNGQVLNISRQKYNSYAYITSGGTFNGGAGTPLFYPGAPLTLFGSVGLSF